MPEMKGFDFERSRGIVWVCDLVRSSTYLNDNTCADDLEEFVPRLFWVSSGLVEAADGRFLKWTGDGFVAWFETPLHRLLGEQAARVFMAASYLSFLVSETQLGLSPTKRFSVRHGIAHEQDAFLMRITHPDGHEALEVIGRGVVFASRLSGIPAPFPGIVTQGELVKAARPYGLGPAIFRKRALTSEDKTRFFKGERWGTETVYTSVERQSRPKNVSGARSASRSVPSPTAAKITRLDDLGVLERFLRYMRGSPDWCRPVVAPMTRLVDARPSKEAAPRRSRPTPQPAAVG